MPVTAATGKERDKIHVQIHRSMPLEKGRREKEDAFLIEEKKLNYL